MFRRILGGLILGALTGSVGASAGDVPTDIVTSSTSASQEEAPAPVEIMPGFRLEATTPIAGTGEFIPDAWTPPGTLGVTYFRPSHPVPLDKHPRLAMLAVRDKSSAKLLTVREMGGFRMKSGVWLFESSRPLDFGACHIVRVEARKTPQDIEPYASKFVRLIPGRVVYLDFSESTDTLQ